MVAHGVAIPSRSGARITHGRQIPIAQRAIVQGTCTVSSHVNSSKGIGPDSDPTTRPQAQADANAFAEDVAHANRPLVQGYTHIQNES